MAVTAREVIMVFRGQNYLSSAIRRVGRDVSTLSRSQQVNMQRQQLQIVGQRLMQSRAVAQAELQSVQIGARKLAQERAVAEQKVAQMRSDATLLRNQAQLGRATRAVQAGRPLRGFNMAETRLQQRALQLQVEAASAAIENEQIAIQQLKARETQLIEREAQLTQIINTRTRAIELNTIKLNQNALAMRSLPWQSFQSGARAVEHAGRVLQMFGLIGTAALGAAAVAAANLNSSVVLAATQARPPGAPVARTAAISTQVQKQVLDLMRQFPAAAQEQSDAFYQIFSGTNIQNVGKATELLKTFNQMAVAGGADLATMVQAGISLHNVFPGEFRSATQAANVFFSAVRYGRLNADQLAQALGYIAPIAKDVGLRFKNVAGDIAFFTRQTGGRMTRQDAQGLARLYQLLAREDVSKGLAGRGIAVFNQAGKMRPLVDILDQIRTKLHLTNQQTINFFKTISAEGSGKSGTMGTIQALRIFSLGVNSGNAYRNVVKLVAQDQNEMVRSFEAMSKTPGVRWKEFINQMKVLVYTIGTQAIPVFIKLSRPLQAAIHWFDQLSPHAQKTIAVLLTIGSAGALILGTVAAIGGGIASLIASFALWRLSSRGAAGGLAALSSEAGFITMRGILGLGIPLAIPLLIHYRRQVGEVADKLGGVGNTLQIAFAGVAAMKFTALIIGLRSVTAAEISATTWAGKLQLALLGLSGSGALGVLAKLAPALGLVAGAELPAIPDIVKQLQGKDPFGQPTAQALRITPAAHKLVFGINNQFTDQMGRDINRPSRVAREFGYNTANDIIKAFLSKKMGPREFNLFTEQFFASSRAATKDFNIRLSDIASGSNIAKGDSSIAQHAQGMKNLINITDQYSAAMGRAAAAERRARNLDRAAGITTKDRQRSVQQWISTIEQARDKMLGAPNDYRAAQRYEKLLDLLNKRFKDQPALLAAINDVLSNYDSNLKQTAKDAQTLGVTTQDALQGVKQMYDNFLQQETSAFGQLFSGPFVNAPTTQNNLQWGGMLTGGDLVKDLRSQLTQFRQFHGQINQLARRGAPPELLKQLEALGPAALKQIEALNKLPPNALRGYFKLFQESQRAIHQQTMRDLNNQLRQYRRYGRGIALAIIAGLRDENVALTKSLTRMIRQMFPGLPTGETGAGGRPTHKAPGGNTTIQHNKTEYHVTAPKSNASIKAQVRHADITRRNKNQGRGGVPR